ncbi:MAG: acyltransferase, partial [Anaerolineales bacterium]|nr:acyltransferase [Anaerolineales bacterium]
ALTGLRTIAAGLVFFYHWFFTHAASLPFVVRAPFDVGYSGVPIFFALSGFLITLRYEADFRHGRVTYRSYIFKRIIRIFPLYLFVLIGFVFAFGRPENMMPTTGRETIILLTLTQALFPSTMLIGTTVGWTLTVEFIYYAIAPLLLKQLGPKLSFTHIGIYFFLYSTIGLLLGWLLSVIPNNNFDTLAGENFFYIMHYSIFGHLPDFLIGMVAASLYLKPESRPWFQQHTRWVIWGGLLIMYGSILLLAQNESPLGSPANRFLAFSIAGGVSILILGTSCDAAQNSLITRFLSLRVMVYLGVTSYALYLIQLTEPIQWLYWLLLGNYLSIENQIWRAVFLYLIAIPLSALLYEFIEKPAHRWLKNIGFLRNTVSAKTNS